jgi:hypothetical protein
MRKDFKLVMNDLYDALRLLGYYPVTQDHAEWRRHEFHLFVRKKNKQEVALSMHLDLPSAIPPFHRALQKSKSIEEEFNKILEAYRRKRHG